MKRLERLLDLVHVLQSARRPLTFEELKLKFSDYAEGRSDAVRRKFERDKAQLSNIGIVIEYDEDNPGYRLNTEASFLPEVELSEKERAVLTAAAKNAIADQSFPYRGALRMALAKLGDADAPMLPVAIGGLERGPAGLFEAIAHCLARGTRLWIRHKKPNSEASERLVDPHGVFLKNGSWYLAGHDHQTGGPRVFELSRIVEWHAVESAESSSSDVSNSISAKQWGADSLSKEPCETASAPGKTSDTLSGRRLTESLLRTSPLHYEIHKPMEVSIRVDAQIAFMLRDWGAPLVNAGTATYRLSVTNKAHLLDQLLALGQRAELLSPPSLRKELAEIYSAIADAHRGAAE